MRWQRLMANDGQSTGRAALHPQSARSLFSCEHWVRRAFWDGSVGPENLAFFGWRLVAALGDRQEMAYPAPNACGTLRR